MDIAPYKPILAALVLPPVPGLVLILVGARLILPRRAWGYFFVLLGVMSIWMGSCAVTGQWLQDLALRPPGALAGDDVQRLKSLGSGPGGVVATRVATRIGIKPAASKTAIIVLGSGREALAREYGVSDLSGRSVARLRYGIWLSRQTGVPVGFSGGLGWAQQQDGAGSPEADVAARIAQQQFGWPLRWTEAHSSDTRGNAGMTVAMLGQEGVTEIVVVTDAFHMPRAKRDFAEAAAQAAINHADWPAIRITPAPMGFWSRGDRPLLDWLPSVEGFTQVRLALHELIGLALRV